MSKPNALSSSAPPRKPPRTKTYVTILILLALMVWSAFKTEATLTDLITGMPEMGKLLVDMVPPDWSYIDVIFKPMMQTIQMAVIGTTFGALLAIPVAFLAAGNVTKALWLYYPARFILNLIRTIPELLFAAIFVAIFGLGPLAGVLAIVFFSFGLIAKLTYESIEAIDPGPLEAMTAVGANKIQWIQFGVVPQVLAQFLAYLLYTFEVNVRAAAVLGLVGAGGIGLLLDRSLNQLRYDRASLIILVTLIVVLVIDYISTRIREYLLYGKSTSAATASKPSGFRIRFWLVAVIIFALYAWSFTGIQFEGIKETAGQISRAIVRGLFHPDWAYVYIPEGEDLLRGLLDTLAISILGTFISAILAVPFAFWAANNMSKFKSVTGSGKFILSCIRTFPEIVMAIIFIKAVGPGAYAGVLALGLHSIGMLAKLYSEAIENMDLGPTEALTACGANRLQVLWFAVIPQVLPEFFSFSLYRFEINIRSASILGIVGAGGIGTPLLFALEARAWPRVGIILLGIIVMVTLIDLISGYIRKRLV